MYQIYSLLLPSSTENCIFTKHWLIHFLKLNSDKSQPGTRTIRNKNDSMSLSISNIPVSLCILAISALLHLVLRRPLPRYIGNKPLYLPLPWLFQLPPHWHLYLLPPQTSNGSELNWPLTRHSSLSPYQATHYLQSTTAQLKSHFQPGDYLLTWPPHPLLVLSSPPALLNRHPFATTLKAD